MITDIVKSSKENQPKAMADLGRGKRLKKRKYPSDADGQGVATEGSAKKINAAAGPSYQQLMGEILEKESLETTYNQDEVIKNLQDEITALKEEKKQLRAENKNLRKSIRLITNLPELLAGVSSMMEKIQSFQWPTSSEETATKSQKETETHSEKVARLVKRCNTLEPAKLVNDLLTGLYDEEYLSSHTITGTVLKENQGVQKEGMDPLMVNEIISTVAAFFPEKKPAEIKYFMRQKLANSAKTSRRKQLNAKKIK
ncbi:BEN domain-containing protein 6 [Holothuria leucospilota]|uniref:BEN domain-containing protein 6 n=1 Tax=Holothuria leucospilota TaxID=206669 RepID=A0A9Q0YBI9_HOLLE|nr:BEN domain-containing protein 6 [Holothuria leucospilota]